LVCFFFTKNERALHFRNAMIFGIYRVGKFFVDTLVAVRLQEVDRAEDFVNPREVLSGTDADEVSCKFFVLVKSWKVSCGIPHRRGTCHPALYFLLDDLRIGLSATIAKLVTIIIEIAACFTYLYVLAYLKKKNLKFKRIIIIRYSIEISLMVNKSGLDAVYYFLFKILYKSTNIGMLWDPQYLILDFLWISYYRNV
jgi:hypothetical protein